MNRILQSIHAVEGVQGSLIVDSNGRVLAFQAHAVYDAELMEKVGQTILSTVDSVRLLHEDWETLSASFTDGTILLRNIRPEGTSATRSTMLAIIGDNRLNPSFAGVAMRVAATKLKSLLESPEVMTEHAAPAPSATSAAARSSSVDAPSASSPAYANAAARPASDLASSGLSWSGLGSSTRANNEAPAADGESTAFLAMISKSLGAIVGPMAKVLVKESVRRISPDRPFSRPRWEALIQDVAKHIHDPGESAQFQKAMRAQL